MFETDAYVAVDGATSVSPAAAVQPQVCSCVLEPAFKVTHAVSLFAANLALPPIHHQHCEQIAGNVRARSWACRLLQET